MRKPTTAAQHAERVRVLMREIGQADDDEELEIGNLEEIVRVTAARLATIQPARATYQTQALVTALKELLAAHGAEQPMPRCPHTVLDSANNCRQCGASFR